MEKQPIEETLTPTTVNEVLLLNRIRQLHRDRIMNRNSFDFNPITAKDDFDFVVSPHQHTLYLAAEAAVDQDWKGFNLTARSGNFKDDKLNVGYKQFVDKSVLDGMWNKYQVVNLLGQLHEKLIYSLAKHIENN